MEQFEVRADTTKNRIYIHLRGFFIPRETEKAMGILMNELAKLKPGFDHITDVTELSVAMPEGTTVLRQLFDMYTQKGIGRTFFVMGESLARMQILRAAKEAGLKIEIAASVEEAERMLDKPS